MAEDMAENIIIALWKHNGKFETGNKHRVSETLSNESTCTHMHTHTHTHDQQRDGDSLTVVGALHVDDVMFVPSM